MANREDELTIACVRYFKLKYPNEMIYHVANQRKTGKARGAKLKKMGVLAGVSDLHVPVAKGRYIGLVIELKHEKNVAGKMVRGDYPTPEQREFLSKMHTYGYAVYVCWNLDEFMALLDRYMRGDKIECEYLVKNGHLNKNGILT